MRESDKIMNKEFLKVNIINFKNFYMKTSKSKKYKIMCI